MQIKTLNDITEIKNKKILLRVDFNVPLAKDGKIQDDTRIRESLPTINFLSEKGAKLIIITHIGRPKGTDESLRTKILANRLSELLNKEVKNTNQILGNEVKDEINKLNEGEILILENIRFDAREEQNDDEFTKELAELGDIYVNDAFGTAHRAHASTAGLAKYLPAYGGLLMEKEIENLSPIVEGNFKKPLAIICGGSKIDTKIGIIKNFLHKADYFLIGGGLANTFIKAAGYNVGNSLYEEDKLELAREIMLEAEKYQERIVLPKDTIVATDISENAETINIAIEDIEGDMKILDVGKWSVERFCDYIKKSGTVIWNGPLGVSEYTPFRRASAEIANCMKDHPGITVIGGGDTIDCINRCQIPLESFTHVSTGGGASIEFLAGQKLPGIEVLIKD